MASIDIRVREFLEMLSELSAQFINLPVARVDQEIEDAQRKICSYLGVDRCTLWRYNEEYDLIMTHMWASVPIAPGTQGNVAFPWVVETLLRRETFRMESVDDLPPEAAVDRASFQNYGAKSNLTVPLVSGEEIVGALAFATIYEPRRWTDEDVQHIGIVAQIFANVLDRKKRDLALQESEARLRMTVNTAGAGLWSVNSSTGAVWATERTRELFGFPATGNLSVEMFFETIHPDDRDLVRSAVARSMATEEELRVEFRVAEAPEGGRWVASRGRREPLRSSGEFRLMGVSLDVTERKQAEVRLRASYEEIVRLKDRLLAEKEYLVAEVHQVTDQKEIIGESAGIQQVLRQIGQVGPTMTTVLVTGETGTGKELVARSIHAMSARRGKMMVKVDCASLPGGLIESELFGRERGAYTGAMTSQLGRFRLADGSTIFLDEIGELSLDLQTKLLRVLDERKFEPLGGSRTVSVDVRIVAATNRDLARAVREGKFREDLYYRLQVFPIKVPPLRERVEDIPALVWHFVRKFSADMGKAVYRIPRESMEALQGYRWPGNIRELKNVIEQAFIVSTGDTLTIRVPALSGEDGSRLSRSLEEAEQDHIRRVLARTGGRIKGAGGAAEILRVKPSTLYSKMKKLGITPRREQGDPST